MACAALALLTACAYEPRSLDRERLLADLNSVGIPELEPPAGEPPAVKRLDLDAGLDEEDAVAVALVLSPDLAAIRREEGIAQGGVVAAGLYPNPELSMTARYINGVTRSFNTIGFSWYLVWGPPRPGELAGNVRRAEARVEEVRARIRYAEWQLGASVRQGYVLLAALDEQLRLARLTLDLKERVRRALELRVGAGESSKLDLNLASLEYQATRREVIALENERERVRQALNRLIGIPPGLVFRLSRGADAIAYRPIELDPARLEHVMLERRPEVDAAVKEYEQTEYALRVAEIRRWAWFKAGPSAAHDDVKAEDEISEKFGGVVNVWLPIVNQNQGEVAIQDASRERARQGARALLHRGRAEVHEAVRSVRAQERLIRQFLDDVRPLVDEAFRLAEVGLAAGEFDVLRTLVAQNRVLAARRDFVGAQAEYWRAAYELERALGVRLSEVTTRPR